MSKTDTLIARQVIGDLLVEWKQTSDHQVKLSIENIIEAFVNDTTGERVETTNPEHWSKRYSLACNLARSMNAFGAVEYALAL